MTSSWILITGMMLGGITALVLGAEMLVRGASRLAISMKISPLVVGLTVVAFGTSAPELAVSVASSLAGDSAIAVGNVVGSNIFNVLVILGASALIVPLTVHLQLLRIEIPLVVFVSLVCWLLAWNGQISRTEGIGLLVGLILYTAWTIRQCRAQNADVSRVLAETTSITPGTPSRWWVDVLLVLAGLGVLVLGSRWLVQGASELAAWLGISSTIIGLTIVAAGTSLPEVATSLMAAVRGEKDIAVGNVIGSNLFNLLGVLGAAAVVSPVGVVVADSLRSFDIPVMILVAAICLPICRSGERIVRLEGALLLLAYITYMLYLIGTATSHPLTPSGGQALWYGAIPAAALIFIVTAILGRPSRPDSSPR